MPNRNHLLNLRAGELVEVKQAWEILATLDGRGRYEELPFMPEMLQFCGRRYRVFKRADKACDNIATPWSIRRMKNAVHLEGGRCDGSGHDGCEAGCLMYWKEAWLRRVESDTVAVDALGLSPADARPGCSNGTGCSADRLVQLTRVAGTSGEELYSCQATELRNFTSYMAWWDLRQYIRDVRSGNLSVGYTFGSLARRKLETLLAVIELLRGMMIGCFNIVQRWRDGAVYPHFAGNCKKTPIEILDLQPGEMVEVRSKEEIIATLDHKNKNRGLLFDPEMLRYCGRIYRVLRRVHHIIDEKTGKMLDMKYPCIVLEGVWCESDYHRFCPRAIYSYWRENWLKRAVPADVPSIAAHRQQPATLRVPCLEAAHCSNENANYPRA
jgi:hypothetical protein